MGNRRDTIINVTIDLFFKKGYFATSISEIARGCSIQKASIYYHFSSKEELLFAIMQTTMADLMTELENELTAVVGTECRMRAAVHNHIRFHLQRQKETFIANSELRGLAPNHLKFVIAQRDAYESIFQDLIAKGVNERLFARNDIKVLSYAILTLCAAGASWYRPDGRLSVDAIAKIYEDFVLQGLKSGRAIGRPAEMACEPWPM